MEARKRNVITETEDGMEKMILRWLANTDEYSKLHFSPYIKL
jgi:hypothetical protein